ncbi:hypothetical protein DN824_01355 [Stutzerimonas nosocomialis]|nr:PAS domain S-box protein [Stutzerimonas nosocomialis]TLX60976.1 hypothetical protein DN824_01355 [Stutzerimonas nosocomialis]
MTTTRIGTHLAPVTPLVIGTLLLSLFFAFLAYDGYRVRDGLWQQQMERQGRFQTQALQNAQQGLLKQAESLAGTLARDTEMLEVVRQIDAQLRSGAALDAPAVQALRQRLHAILAPSWQAMAQHQVRQLELYWGEAGKSLLRLHDPQAHGDDVAQHRELLRNVLEQGRPASGLDIARNGAGNRAIVPLRASDDPASPVIGALEVGLDILPDLAVLQKQIDAGLALITDRQQLEQSLWQQPHGQPLGDSGDWLLDGRSAEHLLDWVERKLLAAPEDGLAARQLESGGRHFLLSQLPLHDVHSERDPAREPLARAMVWHDVTEQREEHEAGNQRLFRKWSSAWLLAELLLLALLLLHRWRLNAQREHLLTREQQQRERAELLERTQKITSLLPGMVYQMIRTPEGAYSFPYVSEGCRDLYGVSAEALMQDPSLAFSTIHPDDHDDAHRTIRKWSNELRSGSFEYRILHPQKGLTWIGGYTTAEARDDGSVLWHGFMADITERKAIDQRIKVERERMTGVLEATQAGTWEWNVQTGALTINPRWAEIIGHTLDSLGPVDIGLWARLVHPDDEFSAAEALAWHFHGEQALFEHDYRLRHRDGHWVWVRVRGQVLSRNAEGEPLMMYGTLKDVSREHEQEEAIRRARAFLEAVIDSSSEVAIIATDPQGTLTLFNAGAELLLGYKAGDVVGTLNAAALLPEAQLAERARALSAALGRPIEGFETLSAIARTGTPETRHWRFLHPDGRVRQLNLTISTITDALGQLTGFLGFASDVTELMETTRALQKSESRFRGMVSNLPGVVYNSRNDDSQTMSYLSEGIERLTGYRVEELIDSRVRSFASLVHPEDLPAFNAARQRQNEDVFERTYRLINTDQQVVWVREKGRAQRNRRGEIVGYDGFIWDITQRVQAESALRLSQERFAALYRLAPVGIVLSRLSDARMLEWNPQLCRMSGYDDRALADLGFLSLMPTLAGDSQALDLLTRDGFHGPYETLLRHADGTQVPVLLNGALMTGDDGQPLVWSIIQDITERAQAEHEVQERERYLRLLIANVIDAIIITDDSGTIETFNHAAERTFGYLEHEVLGRPLSLLLPEAAILCDGGQPAGEMAARQALDHELTAIRRDGEPFTVELRVSQVSHDGAGKFIGLVRDITERKRIERMKSEFVSIVSHELRTPLTSISGALGLITGGALGELSGPMRQMLGIAHQNSLRLGRLIDDLLDMDKLVAGKMVFNLRPLPLAPLLEEALRSHQPYAEQHQVRFVLEPVGDWQVMVDETRLEQVLANFLSNAAKFSPPGEVVVVAVRAQGSGVRVSVTDRGPGIDPEFETRIFQKFSQADSSDTRQKGGTGLGLAISKELVERMHGRIGFDSRPGQGASFWFELPLADEVAETSR